MQPLQPQLAVTSAPFADGHAAQAHPLGNGRVRFASTAGQDDLCALHDRMRQ
jgi:hypothetical protein